jgi:hypothetical protein
MEANSIGQDLDEFSCSTPRFTPIPMQMPTTSNEQEQPHQPQQLQELPFLTDEQQMGHINSQVSTKCLWLVHVV